MTTDVFSVEMGSFAKILKQYMTAHIETEEMKGLYVEKVTDSLAQLQSKT